MNDLLGKTPQKKAKAWKISNGLLVLALVSVFGLGPIIHTAWVNDSTPVQRLDPSGSYDLKGRLLGRFTPTPKYILRAWGTFPSAAHFATVSDYDYLLAQPSLACLIESAHGRFHAAILVDPTLQVRAPPAFLSDKSTL